MAEAERLPHAIPFRLPEAAVTDHGEGDVARELRKKAEPKRRAIAVLKAFLSHKSTKRSHMTREPMSELLHAAIVSHGRILQHIT